MSNKKALQAVKVILLLAAVMISLVQMGQEKE